MTIKLVNVYQAGRIIDGAVTFLYDLLAERPAAANISHREMPTLEQHRAFVTRRPYRAWYIVEMEGRVDTLPESERGIPGAWWVGTVCVTPQNEIGVQILAIHQRKGHARAALTQLLAELKPLDPAPTVRNGRFVANVAPTNEASKALFESLGGKQIQVTYEL